MAAAMWLFTAGPATSLSNSFSLGGPQTRRSSMSSLRQSSLAHLRRYVQPLLQPLEATPNGTTLAITPVSQSDFEFIPPLFVSEVLCFLNI